MSQKTTGADGVLPNPLQVEREGRVARVSIDAPPMNLLGGPLLGALAGLVAEFQADPDSRVIVFRSADPDFFIAHGDVEAILSAPTEPGPPVGALPFTHQVIEGLRKLPQVTIGQIEGMTRGGGSEVSLAFDMRFAAVGRAVFGQPEVALGILPGAGGTARLTRLLGRSRAAEIILGGDDFSAEEAERYGWINRALPPAELGPFVDRLAERIASFPTETLRAAKSALHEMADGDIERDLLLEQQTFDRLMSNPASESRLRMQRFLERGVQTREGERDLASACLDLGRGEEAIGD